MSFTGDMHRKSTKELLKTLQLQGHCISTVYAWLAFPKASVCVYEVAFQQRKYSNLAPIKKPMLLRSKVFVQHNFHDILCQCYV